jgi:hypothetical protein
MTFIFDFVIAIILGAIIFLLLDYFIFHYYPYHDKFIYTESISTETITFTKDYQELLIARLGNNTPYDVIYDKTYFHFLIST